MKTIYIFLITTFLSSLLVAGENFSEMSTQELIAIMGYVKNPNDKEKFRKELKSRVTTMTPSEKQNYEKNLHKLK
jgi:hypothetical protein